MQMPNKSANGNKYVLILIDIASRYLTTIPIQNKTAEIVANKIHEFVLRFGIFETLVPDLGTEYSNALMEKTCELLRVEHLFSIAYHHHESSAHAERVIHTIRDHLAFIINQDSLDWEAALPFAAVTYNTSFHSAIENSPHFLFYGRDHMMNLTDSISNVGPLCLAGENYAVDMQDRYAISLHQVKELIEKQHLKNKSYYDHKSHTQS